MNPLNLTGRRFGRLVATHRAGSDGHGCALWQCACDCGGETTVYATGLRRGRTRSCGCLSAARPIDATPELAERLRAMAPPRGDGECWIWQGRINDTGYGSMSVSGRIITAHRAAWVLANGNSDPRLKVCHRCDSPPCCNPAHLFLGTDKDNGRAAVAKGRNKFPDHSGARNPTAKLTAATAREVVALRREGVSQRVLGERFGVSQSTISELLRGRTWKLACGGEA